MGQIANQMALELFFTDCDCIVSFYSFHGTEKDMLSVLKKKAEERRQALAERPEYVTDIEYDELTSSWHINILSDNLEVTESITAKPVDLIECLNA